MRKRVFLISMFLFVECLVQTRAGSAESLISWLLDQAYKIQIQQDEIDPMMWMYENGTQAREGDVAEIAYALEAMGLGRSTDVSIKEKERYLEDCLKEDLLITKEVLALHLLWDIGCGQYDDMFCWHPSSNTVFAMDAELFGGEALYHDFFKGLNAICDGEMVFSEIQEDYSDANLEEGTGIIHIRFMVNGEEYFCDVQMMSDWFDAKIFNDISQISAKDMSERRLYATYDGLQGLIFLYQTPEWVQEFSKRTGCVLSEAL